MILPIEILELIASELNAIDLRSFRLASNECARAGAFLVGHRGISIIDTAACLKDLNGLLDCVHILKSIKKLTIFHGEWPICSRKDWEIHPLLFDGNARSNVAYVQNRCASKADSAFRKYTEFIADERARKHDDDIETLGKAMKALGNLRTVNISHMKTLHASKNPKYSNLRGEIWMTPYRQDRISPAVRTFLLAFVGEFPNIQNIGIHGAFDATEVTLAAQYPSIRALDVGSFHVHQSQETIRRFLLAFPNLLHLSIGFQGWGPSIPDIVGDLYWPNLQTLKLKEIWASEQDIINMFTIHQKTLKAFALNHAALTQGSWKSLFSRLRDLNTLAEITAEGELYGRRSRDTLILDRAAAADLGAFMWDRERDWPFL